MGLNLLEKRELWINNIILQNANLTELAKTVAGVLGIEEKNVLVVDVRQNNITLDILEEDIPQENILGKEKTLLDKIGALAGVTVSEETYIHSEGILGTICLESDEQKKILENISRMTDDIRKNIARRAIIFPTGFEVRDKMIEDTNTPFLKEYLESEGFKVTVGRILEDDINDIEYGLEEALSKAYGLIITTGGVGAEDKDKTVESILRIDPEAATPYIVKFEKGTGRHVKDGIKIAVGTVGPAYIVAFPGPNDEVRLAAKVVIEGVKSGESKESIAQKMAAILAEKLTGKKLHHGGHFHGEPKYTNP